MHLPDGVLPIAEWAPLAGVSAVLLGVAATRARTAYEARRVPTAGFLGAVVLLLQTLNFPIVGGASGHLVGTTLLVYVVGIEMTLLVMAAVLLLQAVVFQDGGILALGANYVNMVAVPALIALLTLPIARKVRAAHLPWVAGATAWLAVVAGSFSCASQVALAELATPRAAFGWLGGTHMLVGGVEAVLTGAAIASLSRRGRVFGVAGLSGGDPRAGGWITSALALAVAAAVFVPFASRRPDALERLLQQSREVRAAPATTQAARTP